MKVICTLILSVAAALPALAAPRPRHPADLPPNSRQLFTDSMRIADKTFDHATHLVHYQGYREGGVPGKLAVRETSWYALGLLLRDGPGDRIRAAAALNAVLKEQYLDPETKWYGTFRRVPSEPLPPANATDFVEFDPNWRVFIGTTFEMILADFPERISPEMAAKLYRSIDIAVKGEKHEGRLTTTYTNPALMYGALWDFIAEHDHDKARLAEAAAWNAEVYRLWAVHKAFGEYNSPTYYGIDLFGLGLWRSYGSNAVMRAHGSEMESALWADVADFYQPELRNIAGPYDRSYGMDMQHYTSPMGLWIRTILPADKAPLPPIQADLDHALDDWLAPLVVVLGTEVPPDARAKLERFVGPHQVSRVITGQRGATAWVGTDMLFGAESTHRTVGVSGESQFHPVTVQWKTPSGAIGWIMVSKTPPIDATANRDGIAMETDGDVTLRIHAPGVKAADLTETAWRLPGLTLNIATDAAAPAVTGHGAELELTYRAVHWMKISTARP